MTDLQFLEYKRLSDELAEAEREIEMLRGNQGVAGEPNMSDKAEDGMTDLQFLAYKDARDKLEEALREQIALLQSKCDALEKENAALRDSQTIK